MVMSKRKHKSMELLIYHKTICREAWGNLLVVTCPTFYVDQNPINMNVQLTLCTFGWGWGGDRVNPY